MLLLTPSYTCWAIPRADNRNFFSPGLPMGVGTRMHTGAKCSKTGYSMVLIFLINLWWKLAKLKTCCCFFSVSFPGVARHGTGLFWAHLDLQRLEHHRDERKGRSTESHLPCPHQVWLRPTSKEPSTWIHDFLCSTLPSPPLHLPRRPVRVGVVLGGLWETPRTLLSWASQFFGRSWIQCGHC